MAKKAIVILANGFEEIEALTPIDLMRRAGVDVTVAGLSGNTIESAHGVKITVDKKFTGEEKDFDCIVLPGGLPGADNLAASDEVLNLLKEYADSGKIVAAICASPSYVLEPAGVLKGKSATCYPGAEGKFSDNVNFKRDIVVKDENIITSRGPATAFPFSFAVIEALEGKDKADEISEQTLYHII